MKSRRQEREEIQIQECVHLQEILNTIFRSLERMERLENINRNNPVRRNADADHIHSEYDSMKEALITQCFCLQAGMTNRKFQSDQVRSDLRDRVEDWKRNLEGPHTQKINEALEIVNQAIQGRMNFNDHSMGGLPTDHRQAVGSIQHARADLDEKMKKAKQDPYGYFQSNEYPLKMGENFRNQNSRGLMEIDHSPDRAAQLREEIRNIGDEINRLERQKKDSRIHDVKRQLENSINELKSRLESFRNELKTLGN